MNKYVMVKKLISVFLIVILAFSFITVNAEKDETKKTLDASYGTPVIDGKIDDIWNTTSYTFIDRSVYAQSYDYTGWMKVLWDENNLYVLANVHTLDLATPVDKPVWQHDCIEIFVDENCGKTSSFEEDDYQLRSDFNASLSALNYDVEKLQASTETFDMGFVVEMAFPMKKVKLKEGLTMGFDAQVYRTGGFCFSDARIGWNSWRTDISTANYDYGTLTLRKSVAPVRAVVPEFAKPVVEDFSVLTLPYTEEVTLVSDVSAMYNYTGERSVSLLHVNEYPCMEINALANLIGATVENGNTLVKDGLKFTYTAGERLVSDSKGHIIMLVEATEYNNQLYVPLSSLETTFIYDVKYNRFKKELDIIPFNEPHEAEIIIKAKDYGAVGDGVHDDRLALLDAFNAAITASITSGKPTRFELEEGKTYYLSENLDNSHIFWINAVKDFVFDGNGSTLLLSPSQDLAIMVAKSERVRIEDLIIDGKEPAYTQGWIREINAGDKSLVLEIEEGYPNLATDDWRKANSQDVGYICPIQPDTAHNKYVNINFGEITVAEHIEGQLYKVNMVNASGRSIFPYLEVGDRFVANYPYYSYNLRRWSKPSADNGIISIITSGDIEVRNVVTRVGKWMGCAVGGVWGNIKFDNFSAWNEDGGIWSNGRDFIHAYRVRGTLLFENSTVIGTGDDMINTKTSEATIVSSHGERWYTMKVNGNYEQGDELLIYDRNTNKVIGRTFLEEVKYVTSSFNAEQAQVKFDRDIPNIEPGVTVALNISTSAGGTTVRNNTFKNGERWLWVNRSPNCVFEGNYCENMNGSMVAAENEKSSQEGPFPSAMTIRNNHYYCDGNGVFNEDPLSIENNKASIGDMATVDGALIENNVFETSRTGVIMRISDVNELYMINNKIINRYVPNKFIDDDPPENMPVTIRNSVISLIDGLTLDYDRDVEYGVNIAGCEYDVNNIKNIDTFNNKTMKPYKDWWE